MQVHGCKGRSKVNSKNESEKNSLADLVESKPRALMVRDLATLLSVSERLIYRMAADRILPSFRVCGSIRFDPSVTARWLRQTMSAGEPLEISQTRRHA
jgi:predicted DNA-binding transcriptional regulator AlpA